MKYQKDNDTVLWILLMPFYISLMRELFTESLVDFTINLGNNQLL